jgi:aspartate dehydrogenase
MLRRPEVSLMVAPFNKTLRVGVGGLGAIGWPVVRRLAQGMPGLALAAIAARDATRAGARLAECGIAAAVVTPAELAERAEIVIECLPAVHFRAIAEPAIAAGRTFLPLSVGALLDHLDLVERAKATGARIIVPTGALLGLDAVRAAAEGEIRSARLITRKPPGGLAGAPYLVAHGISLAGLDHPLKVFDGTARDGARGFPANVNVAAALALAGIGPDRTHLEIWADPGLERNVHRVEIEADAARLTMTIENVPSAENPRTGRLTPLSVIACLRRLTGTLQIGS